jgi:hypothetical protein
MKTPSFGNHQNLEENLVVGKQKGKFSTNWEMAYFTKGTKFNEYMTMNAPSQIPGAHFMKGKSHIYPDKVQKYAMKLGHNLTQIPMHEPLQKSKPQNFVMKKNKR